MGHSVALFIWKRSNEIMKMILNGFEIFFWIYEDVMGLEESGDSLKKTTAVCDRIVSSFLLPWVLKVWKMSTATKLGLSSFQPQVLSRKLLEASLWQFNFKIGFEQSLLYTSSNQTQSQTRHMTKTKYFFCNCLLYSSIWWTLVLRN